MADFVVTLRDELNRLRSELRIDPRFRRYEMMVGLLADYEQEAAEAYQQPKSAIASQQPRRSDGPGTFIRSKTSKATMYTDAAARYLSNKGSRAKTAEIAQALITQGIMPDDDTSRHNLGAYLSRHKERFNNKIGEGYGLHEWEQPHHENEAPDSSELSGAPRANGGLPLNL
jgi:hypothetical protein